MLSLVNAVDAMGQHQTWWSALLIGIVDLVAAGDSLANPGVSAVDFVLVVAPWAILSGLLEIFDSLLTARLILLIVGVLTVVVGLVFLVGEPWKAAGRASRPGSEAARRLLHAFAHRKRSARPIPAARPRTAPCRITVYPNDVVLAAGVDGMEE